MRFCPQTVNGQFEGWVRVSKRDAATRSVVCDCCGNLVRHVHTLVNGDMQLEVETGYACAERLLNGTGQIAYPVFVGPDPQPVVHNPALEFDGTPEPRIPEPEMLPKYTMVNIIRHMTVEEKIAAFKIAGLKEDEINVNYQAWLASGWKRSASGNMIRKSRLGWTTIFQRNGEWRYMHSLYLGCVPAQLQCKEGFATEDTDLHVAWATWNKILSLKMGDI